MVEIQPLRIAIGREEDGRFPASVPELPGVMAYGDTQESALRKAKAIALQVLADMMESGEELNMASLLFAQRPLACGQGYARDRRPRLPGRGRACPTPTAAFTAPQRMRNYL